MIYTPLVYKAMHIAYNAHHGQLDLLQYGDQGSLHGGVIRGFQIDHGEVHQRVCPGGHAEKETGYLNAEKQDTTHEKAFQKGQPQDGAHKAETIQQAIPLRNVIPRQINGDGGEAKAPEEQQHRLRQLGHGGDGGQQIAPVKAADAAGVFNLPVQVEHQQGYQNIRKTHDAGVDQHQSAMVEGRAGKGGFCRSP